MRIPLGKKCRKEKCPYYKETEKSHCTIFSDRRACSIKVTDEEYYNRQKKWS